MRLFHRISALSAVYASARCLNPLVLFSVGCILRRRFALLISCVLMFSVVIGQGVATANETAAEQRPSYADVFRIKNIAPSLTNNGGEFTNSELYYAVDGLTDSHWETARQNTDTFHNEVIVDFRYPIELGRIGYWPRVEGARLKGYPTRVSIYASPSETGEDYTLVHQGSYSPREGELMLDFGKSVTAQRIKFVFDEAYQNWAAIGELVFYKFDEVSTQVNAMFTDTLFTQLAEGVTSEQVEALYTRSLTHPDGSLTDKLLTARALLAGQAIPGRIITPAQDGNVRQHTHNVLKMANFGSSLLPTGIAARPGETVTVYVDIEPHKPLPSIVFSQNQGTWNGWKQGYKLLPGTNTFTVPSFANPQNKVPGGPIYIENPYTPEQQGVAPRIRISGGYDFPLFAEGDDVEEYKNELRNYLALRESDPSRYADVAEIASPWITATGTTENASRAYLEQNRNPQEILDFHKKQYQELLKFAGVTDFDGSGDDPKARVLTPRQVVRATTMPGAGYFAYATGDHTGFSASTMNGYFGATQYGWGIAHELGHHLDAWGAKWDEVTNNMWANYNQVVLEKRNDRIEERQYDKLMTSNARDDYATNAGPVSDLSIFWQLFLYDHDYWAKYQRARRDDLFSQLSEVDRIVALSSAAIGYDMTEHFDRHHYFQQRYPNNPTAQATAKERVKAAIAAANIPAAPADFRTWYMWTKALNTDQGFTDLSAPTIEDVTYANGNVTVTLSDPLSRDEARLGYEIMVDGKVMAFVRNDSITFPIVDDGQPHTYSVRAFDIKLQPTVESAAVTVNYTDPRIYLTGPTFVPRGASMETVARAMSAYDSAGNQLQVTADANTIDTTKTGIYRVNFTATDAQGRSKTKNQAIHVVARTTYISDMPTVTETDGWRGMAKDRKIESNTPISLTLGSGVEHPFPKGIVSHAPARVTYDLSNMNAQFFEAYLGIEGAVRQSSGNIIMEVLADGQSIFKSSPVTSSSPARHIVLDVTDVKTLELVTDSNGPNTADHGVWAAANISEYFLADRWKPESTGITRPEGEDVTEGDVYASLTNMAPAAKIASKELLTDIPTENGKVDVLVTYTDNSTSEVSVPITFVKATPETPGDEDTAGTVQGLEIPSTGGRGAVVIYAAALFLACVALLGAFAKKRHNTRAAAVRAKG